MAELTPFQTVGPYLSLGLRACVESPPTAQSDERIQISGRLLDGRGEGIPDGVLEWWQPAAGAVQRTLTGDDGGFTLDTVKPTPVAGPDGREQAPHFAVRILGRGILTHYVTRMYFDDELAHFHDAVLDMVPTERRHTLIASRVESNQYRFNVVVQGDNETVFFDF